MIMGLQTRILHKKGLENKDVTADKIAENIAEERTREDIADGRSR